MDVIERLTLEAAQADTMLAGEHRQRYEFAAGLCAGARVLDLCCGSGYGTRILATQAQQVVGVDNDAATIDTANATLGRELSNARFELADAVRFLRGEVEDAFDLVVCFEGLEHLRELDEALLLLRDHAERGLRILASVPNGKLFGEQNPYHVTEFGYDEAIGAFAEFPSVVMVPQFLAEGSLICPPEAQQVEVAVTLDERDEPEYANHFIFCVNFDPAQVQGVHHGRLQLSTSPLFNRWAEDLKRGASALRRENARLGRARLGKAGSAAASKLSTITPHEAQVGALQERCRVAEARVRELEETNAWADGAPPRRPVRPVVVLEPARDADVRSPVPVAPGEDPNTWEHRRRRAADIVIPWIEQTVPLAGKTVLEYGCGNAAVSCAFAERAGRLIGVDIDRAGIELARQEIRSRGIENVDLELHGVESIIDAVAARKGEIDVFLCYAVLEHLTLGERLEVLRLAREVVRPGGAIVVCETPNRLIYFDHHTAQMPFFHLLPDELALDYYPRSARSDFKAAIDAAAEKGHDAALEAIVRWGRGVSFHEFEVAFGDLSRHVIASSYDPILFPERPVHPEEVILSRYLDRSRPDLAPAWSRYWLDLILSPQPVAKRPVFLRPWSADTGESVNVGWTRWDNLHLGGPDAILRISLPHQTGRLVVGSVTQDGHPLAITVDGEGFASSLVATTSAPAGHTAFTTFPLPEPGHRLTVAASRECHLVFVGYDG